MPDPEWTVAPCGCGFGLVGDTFLFERCDDDCVLYLWALAEIERAGIPHETFEL